MNIKRPHIILEGIQIKSLEKARKLSEALTVIEEECGIHETKITIRDSFICPWIDKDKLNQTEMEKLIKDILNQL